MLALEDHWVWDSWYLHDGIRWHCWYLKAPKAIGDPALRHWRVSQGHAVSEDLANWRDHSTSLEPSPGPAWDDCTTWTGSVVRGEDGLWHYFYTGTSRAEDGLIQRIGHATGEDLIGWERAGDGPCLDIGGSCAKLYETEFRGRWHDRAMRDPWVMKDPEGDGWLMFFTARVPDVEDTNAAGCIGLASSPDLFDWTLRPPVFVGGWGQLEVPQVFERGGDWYCLFCMDPSQMSRAALADLGEIGRGSHYLIGESPRGPWRLPPGPGFDTEDERYAARIVDHHGLKLLGFKDGESRGAFGGYIMDPVPVLRRPDGALSLEG